MLRIGLLFGALALCAGVNALWTSSDRQDVHAMGLGFPESFVADEAQTDALRVALARWSGRELEASERRR